MLYGRIAIVVCFLMPSLVTSSIAGEAMQIDVTSFGAKGDGKTDDTDAVQKAIDATPVGATLRFPPGRYRVGTVGVRAGIRYLGEGATIERPDNQPNYTRSFTTSKTGYGYSGDDDSPWTTFEGFTFDGNRDRQGSYTNYELEQSQLLFLSADPAKRGRLRVRVENCHFKNCVSDGLSIYTNVEAIVTRCSAFNCFRGGFVLTGGYSRVTVDDFASDGDGPSHGIDIEVDGRGYGESFKVEVQLKKLRLRDGNFDIVVSEGSTVTGEDIEAAAPFYLFCLNSTMTFERSRFDIGACDTFMNRILFPHRLSFIDCEFRVVRKETGKPFTHFAGAEIWWQHPIATQQSGQQLLFDRCRFTLDKSIRPEDKTYAIRALPDAPDTKNSLTTKDCQIAPEFDNSVIQE